MLFVVAPPRSGSTLLQRMLGAHSAILTHPEPHLITPLAYLGYHATVDKAPYDHINAAEAIRVFVANLPRGEADYLDALRAYSSAMYGRMLATSGARYFLDKTPAYALVLDFLVKLYPDAKYVVLTRHPMAVMSSYANSFFGGDWQQAQRFNPILNRYVPAMARFLRERPAELIHVSYETLVNSPQQELERICGFLELPNEPEAVNYGKHFEGKKGRGDPLSVDQHDRPVASFVDKWVGELLADPEKLALARRIVDRIDPADLEQWGHAEDEFFAPLDRGEASISTSSYRRSPWNSYVLQRRILLALRKDIHDRPLGRMLRRVRYYCDVLLRE